MRCATPIKKTQNKLNHRKITISDSAATFAEVLHFKSDPRIILRAHQDGYVMMSEEEADADVGFDGCRCQSDLDSKSSSPTASDNNSVMNEILCSYFIVSVM